MIVTPRKAWNGSVSSTQQHPERVAHPTRHRVDAHQRPEEQAAHDDQVHVHGLVDDGDCSDASYQPEKYSAHGETTYSSKVSGGKVSTLADPRVEHRQQPARGRGAGCAGPA
jgi:hypothetical protein